MRAPKSQKQPNKKPLHQIKPAKGKRLESITVSLLGVIITLYGVQGLLTGRISASGNSWKAGWQADGSAAFFICLAVSLFGAGVIYAAFKNWRS